MDGNSNLANAIIKEKLCHALQELININMVKIKILGKMKEDMS